MPDYRLCFMPPDARELPTLEQTYPDDAAAIQAASKLATRGDVVEVWSWDRLVEIVGVV